MAGKVVVITGASSGIGAALAIQLGGKGYQLALAARRDQELRDLALETNTDAVPILCDVRNRSDVDNLAKSAIEKFGHVDIWVNNAGRGIRRKVMDLNEDEFDEMIRVNLKSAWYGMQAIIPHFQEREEGHLINISTFLSRVPFATYRSAYSASKAALNILTSHLRQDLKSQYPGIHISLVLPGVVTTDFAKNALGGTPDMSHRSGAIKTQSADEAAAAIVSLIENPKPEIFTNPALAQVVLAYYNDVAGFEERI